MTFITEGLKVKPALNNISIKVLLFKKSWFLNKIQTSRSQGNCWSWLISVCGSSSSLSQGKLVHGRNTESSKNNVGNLSRRQRDPAQLASRVEEPNLKPMLKWWPNRVSSNFCSKYAYLNGCFSTNLLICKIVWEGIEIGYKERSTENNFWSVSKAIKVGIFIGDPNQRLWNISGRYKYVSFEQTWNETMLTNYINRYLCVFKNSLFPICIHWNLCK